MHYPPNVHSCLYYSLHLIQTSCYSANLNLKYHKKYNINNSRLSKRETNEKPSVLKMNKP